jgi:hypothetical protein
MHGVVGVLTSPLHFPVWAPKTALQYRNTYLTNWRFCQDDAIQQLVLSSESNQGNSEEGKLLNHIFGFVFLNPEEVGGCFVEDFIVTMSKEEQYQQFAEYLTENYIDSGAVFPPTLFASRSSSLQLTTKACVSFHSHLNKYFYHPHAHINFFIMKLKECQSMI